MAPTPMPFRGRVVALLSFLLAAFSAALPAEPTMPRFFSEGAVFQHQSEVPLHGSADPDELLRIRLDDEALGETRADADGQWSFLLPPQPAGGPHTVTVEGESGSAWTIENVLFGEVWLCSGQSNMELPMRRVAERYAAVLESTNNSKIRTFEVPDHYNFQAPESNFAAGAWLPATPEHLPAFSAVAYFFAAARQKETGMPIGLINAALGGSPIEAWMDAETLHTHYPDAWAEAQRFAAPEVVEAVTAQNEARQSSWYERLAEEDRGMNAEPPWWTESLDDGAWATVDLPGDFTASLPEFEHGVIWLRREINLPPHMVGEPAELWLGAIVDADTVWVNGTEVGNTTYKYPPRRYTVPAGLLRAGKNRIAVRMIVNNGPAEWVSDKAYELRLGDLNLPLSGAWLYTVGARLPAIEPTTFIRWKPLGLYQGMIAPLRDFPLSGVLWYQGESNTGSPEGYAEKLAAMVRAWRSQWDDPDLPFLGVQLANFMEAREEPSDSNWAELRDEQRHALESIPHAGMAVIIDAGEWNDIHPTNKRVVGERLAVAAQAVVDGAPVSPAGPRLQSAEHTVDGWRLTFADTDGGLQTREGGGRVIGFSVVADDGSLLRIAAQIVDQNTVELFVPRDVTATHLRYAWADNPAAANLQGGDGRPASPFQVSLPRISR